VYRQRGDIVVRMYGYTHGRLTPPLKQIGTMMRVQVEQRRSGGDDIVCSTPPRDAAHQRPRLAPARPWASLADKPDLTPAFRPSDLFSYWEVRFPDPARTGNARCRVVIEELEYHLAEVRVGGEGSPPTRWADTRVSEEPRVVFLDIVDI
jgi:hypothetical protein